MNEPAKAVLTTLVKSWNKFTAEQAKLETASQEVGIRFRGRHGGNSDFTAMQH